MRRFVTTIAALGVAVLCAGVVSQTLFAAESPAKAEAATTTKATAPANRVVVMYFHRTQRCPTCLKMGGYTEEAVLKGFDKEIKKGTVEFHYIDFQDEQNAALTNGYGVEGPTLIVAQVVDNKVAEYKSLTEIWTKNRDKDVFLKYVRDNVVSYQKAASKTAAKPNADGSAKTAN